MTIPENHRVTPFEREGVWVAAPQELRVRLSVITPGRELLAPSAGFTPIRVIGNLKFENPADPNQERFAFDPPARLQVRYTADDDSKRQGRQLVLAWWDGRQWVPFVPGSESLYADAKDKRYAYFEISSIIDPPISWGR